MILTKDDLGRIRKVKLATKINISGKEFYVKKAYDADGRNEGIDLAINELINAEILKRIGLISPDIEIIKLRDNDIYILSEDIATLGNFKTVSSLGLTRESSSSLFNIWNFLTEKYRDNKRILAQIPELFKEIVTMYLYDIMMGNWDRLGDNWGIIFNDDESEIISLALLDNEYHLDNFIPNISSLPEGDAWFQKRRQLLMEEAPVYEIRRKEAIDQELRRFFYESSSEFYQVFANLYDTLTPKFYEEILDDLEQTKGIHTSKGIIPLEITRKDELIAKYIENYERIGQIWQEAIHGRK